mmetsp:Transcript_11063/g.23872  ORF Transcript_11063/g.23872 Transcript_11063/m.23872 type:complete len:235 (-) Transcript_11063:1115-1819(-)
MEPVCSPSVLALTFTTRCAPRAATPSGTSVRPSAMASRTTRCQACAWRMLSTMMAVSVPPSMHLSASTTPSPLATSVRRPAAASPPTQLPLESACTPTRMMMTTVCATCATSPSAPRERSTSQTNARLTARASSTTQRPVSAIQPPPPTRLPTVPLSHVAAPRSTFPCAAPTASPTTMSAWPSALVLPAPPSSPVPAPNPLPLPPLVTPTLASTHSPTTPVHIATQASRLQFAL